MSESVRAGQYDSYVPPTPNLWTNPLCVPDIPPPPRGTDTLCVPDISPPRGTDPLSLPDISPPWFLRHVGVSPVSVESGSIEISLGQLIPAREHEQII